MTGYNHRALQRVARSRGYETDRAIVQALLRILKKKMPHHMAHKFFGDVPFSFNESFVVADFFEMSPKEYAQVFLSDIFIESREGHFVAHLDDPDAVLFEKSTVAKQIMRAKEKREQERQELAEKVKDL